MEPRHEQGLLEDLVAPWKEKSTTFPSTGLFPGNCNYFESFDEIDTTDQLTSNHYSNPSFLELVTSSSSSVVQPTFHYPYYSGNYPFDHHLFTPPIHSSYDKICQEKENPSMQAENGGHELIGKLGNKKVEPQEVIEEGKSKCKKVEGQPSKNLMAERRRRKRLNERLSMLRSIVPKISKMDRTSILGDTIDYVKELLQKIQTLKDKDAETGRLDQLDIRGSVKGFNMFDVKARTLPKIDVRRQNTDTRIEIHCSSKPGLLLNTVSTLEALGLDIQQCVVSCSNDFSLQASCSEGAEHRTMISSEDLKHVLVKTAGYGGRSM